MEIPNSRIKPSRFDVYLELLCLIALVAYWAYLNLVYESLPERIPIHFNSAGKADGYGNKSNLYELPRVATILYFLLTGLSLFIYLFKSLLFFSLEESEDKLKNMIQTVRFSKFLIIILFFSITLFTLQMI